MAALRHDQSDPLGVWMVRAQKAQARRLGYRDAETRYDPNGGNIMDPVDVTALADRIESMQSEEVVPLLRTLDDATLDALSGVIATPNAAQFHAGRFRPDGTVEGPAGARARAFVAPERLSISYSGEASEHFATEIERMDGYTVRVTPLEGEPFDAVLARNTDGTDEVQWYNEIRCVRATDDGEADPAASPIRIRVADVFVY